MIYGGVLSIEDEFSGADLNDLRLGRRLKQVARDLDKDPARSFPDAAADASTLEGTYRFLGNERVSPKAILRPHFENTRRRAGAEKVVLAIHDSTEFVMTGEREGMGVVTNGHPGFFAHVSLLVSADGQRAPLGVAALETQFRARREERSRPRGRQEHELESWHWWESVVRTEAVLAGAGTAIHVMDRDADKSRLLYRMITSKYRFIVRGRFDRKLDTMPPDAGTLRQRMAMTEELFEREVPLSPRKVQRGADGKTGKRGRTHPSRRTRTAKLAFGSARIKLRESECIDGRKAPSRGRFEVNVVWVREIDPPEGETPVDWLLVTSEPVGSIAEIEVVVDAYRARWVIEEYFKALKTGCAFEGRQLVGKRSILNALAVFIPIAWRLLVVRTDARHPKRRPTQAGISSLELRILRRRPKSKLPDNPTSRDIMLEIARLGGHLKNNGEPGWLTLGRGFEKLMLMKEGALLALGAM